MKVNSKVNEDSEDDWEVAICQNLILHSSRTKTRNSLEISTKFNTKTICTFIFYLKNP